MANSNSRSPRTVTGVFLFLNLLVLSACASTADKLDPLEDINRSVYAFNDFLDRNLLKPVASTYITVTPEPVRTGVNNFYANLRYPMVTINQFLQGKVKLGLQDSGRFLINSTLGIGGILDPATGMGLPAHQEDFGQTLARWGVGSGPFLMVPLLGPATLRDGAGQLAHNNLTYLPLYVDDITVRNLLIVLDFINTRAQLLESEEMISGGDRYLFIRDAYLQRRDFLISDGEGEDDPFLD